MVTIHEHEFNEIVIKDSHNRRALQLKNKIIASLKIFGLTEDDVEIELERVCMKKAPASASWYMLNEHLFYSYNGPGKYVDNLAMVAQVIDFFAKQLAASEITEEKFIEMFAEDTDIVKKRLEARTTLGVDEDSTDFELMHKNYKELSKKYHPDMPEGDLEHFKKINVAHKILKKEFDEK